MHIVNNALTNGVKLIVNVPIDVNITEYQNCLDIMKLLSKLSFNCKKCKNIINYNEMEKHFLSKCLLGKMQNSSDNYEKALTERNYNFQKLDYSDKTQEPSMKLTSKLIYIFIIILFF